MYFREHPKLEQLEIQGQKDNCFSERWRQFIA